MWGQSVPNGAKWYQMMPNRVKWGQTGSNGVKQGQTGNLSQMVSNGVTILGLVGDYVTGVRAQSLDDESPPPQHSAKIECK